MLDIDRETHGRGGDEMDSLADMNLDETLGGIDADGRPETKAEPIVAGTARQAGGGQIKGSPVRMPAGPVGGTGRDFSSMIIDRGRSFSHTLMSIAGSRQRSGRLWLAFAVTIVVTVLLLELISYKHREITIGYELSTAIEEREHLLENNRNLRIELRTQSRRERLEPKAGKELGLQTIRPDQVFIVNLPPKRAGVAKTAAGTAGADAARSGTQPKE